MKNYLSLLTLCTVLLIVTVLSNCQKNPVENPEAAVTVDQKSLGTPQDRDQTETIISTLGSAKSLGISSSDVCSPAKVKVICMQHLCEALRNDPIERWHLEIRYYYVDASGNVVYAYRPLNQLNASVGTWYTLDHPIIKSSELPAGLKHEVVCELVDDFGPFTQKVAKSDLYFNFDCNTSDGVVTMHKMSCNTTLQNSCLYYTQNPVTTTKTLTISNTCGNSSSGSQSLTPAQEYLPCTVSLPPGGGEQE